MAIDFPSSPTNGQTLTAAGKTWTWTSPSYALGATGPGGGQIFITPTTVGNSTGKYFEIAPEAAVGGNYVNGYGPWTSDSYTSTICPGADGTSIGTGYQNTLDIVAQGANIGAGYFSDTLSYGGQTDWFLPSLDELAQVYANKSLLTASNIPDGVIISSTEASATGANTINFVGGAVSVASKGYLYSFFRPVRMFAVTDGKWVVVDKVNNASNQVYDVTVLLRMETN